MKQKYNWLVTGASVRGANHKRNNLPNQDAIKWREENDNLVLAISDGHGSLKHFRSDVGSRLAVEAAIEVILQEVDVDNLTTGMLSQIKDRVKDKLPQRIINCWADKVKKHYQDNLFSLDRIAQTKLEKIKEKKGISTRKKIENNYIKAYGATLLVVLITKRFSLYFKLGDGDVVIFSKSGKQRLFTNQEKLGPATDSLCMSSAKTKAKISVIPFSEQVPLCILLSTDGYINSFRDDSDYLKVVDDIVELIAQQGLEYITNNLEQWLKQTSEQGSGDDITLGLIYNEPFLLQFREAITKDRRD
mgnify:CR=1 FL=1